MGTWSKWDVGLRLCVLASCLVVIVIGLWRGADDKPQEFDREAYVLPAGMRYLTHGDADDPPILELKRVEDGSIVCGFRDREQACDVMVYLDTLDRGVWLERVDDAIVVLERE